MVTGSGAPAAGMVYKLVEVEGRPVAKRSSSKESRGGAKSALRRHKPTGTAVEEVVHRLDADVERGEHDRVVPVPLLVKGEPTGDQPTLDESREHLRRGLVAVPVGGAQALPRRAGDPDDLHSLSASPASTLAFNARKAASITEDARLGSGS